MVPTGTSGTRHPHPGRVQQLVPCSCLSLDQDLRSSWSSASQPWGSQPHECSWVMLTQAGSLQSAVVIAIFFWNMSDRGRNKGLRSSTRILVSELTQGVEDLSWIPLSAWGASKPFFYLPRGFQSTHPSARHSGIARTQGELGQRKKAYCEPITQISRHLFSTAEDLVCSCTLYDVLSSLNESVNNSWEIEQRLNSRL